MRRRIGTIGISIAAVALGAAVAGPAAEPAAEQQRELFRTAWQEAERGQFGVVESLPADERAALESYVLWPDLEGAYLRSTIRRAEAAAIRRYLDANGTTKPARELRYQWSLELVRRGDHRAYLDIYDAFYDELGIARLDCLALQSKLELGKSGGVAESARQLWRVGRSQVDECDPVFDWMRDLDLLATADYEDRFALALGAREFRLARWLARQLDPSRLALATDWLSAQSDPARYLRRGGDGTNADRLAYAAEQLTYDDPLLAESLWKALPGNAVGGPGVRHPVERHIALWTARDRLPGARMRLDALPAAVVDAEVLRWRARTALEARDWPAVRQHIAAMTPGERQHDEWRFWDAVARRYLSDPGAEAALAALAAERGYYGFLAADELDLPYAFGHRALDDAPALLRALERDPALVRARELFLVGLDGRARSEWDDAISRLPADEKLQAAILAHRWGWHSRAIATVAMLSEYDDLELRYPLAFREAFIEYADDAGIPPTWAFGIARSESLFMRDARSGAGAIGLMQLLPSTGREMAGNLQVPYAGMNTLVDAAVNIRLGTAYLARMAARYDGNRILATAAYNAGPQRVDRWRPANEPLDARTWIELIPYNETRRYVRRVLEAETIFHWRLYGETRRLRDQLVAVTPSAPSPRLASASR